MCGRDRESERDENRVGLKGKRERVWEEGIYSERGLERVI